MGDRAHLSSTFDGRLVALEGLPHPALLGCKTSGQDDGWEGEVSSDRLCGSVALLGHRQLQEIADNGWVVPTRVLARVLGQSNSSLPSWGDQTERLGFSIERTGSRGMFRVTSAVTQAGDEHLA